MSAERREVVLTRGTRALVWVTLLGLLLYWLRSVFTPVFLAFTIAYILDPVVDRLEALKKRDPGKKHTWWEKPGETQTLFHGGGDSSQVEATAMAALALSAPQLQHDDGYGAGLMPTNVGLPAPSILAR